MRLHGRNNGPAIVALTVVLSLFLSSACTSFHRPVRPDTTDDAEPSEAATPAVESAQGVAVPPGDPSGPVETSPDAAVAAEPEVLPEEDPVPEMTPHEALALQTPELEPDEAERERRLVESAAPVYDIPIEINDRVLGWVDFYSRRSPHTFEPGLVRSGRYLPMIHRIFAEEGLPLDLGYMAHVESAYKPAAYSRARAKGVFQFIASTGRNYGLAIDFWVDERADPEKSARAASAYLKDLYEMFGDWYLALAAYNGGEGRVRRALERTGASTFWELADRRALRRETINYVPAILAVVLISKDPQKYGFEFVPDAPVVYDTVRVDDAVDLRVLARCAGTDVATLKQLNPGLRRHQTPPGRPYHVYVPAGTGATALAALEMIPRDERVLYTIHVVRSGDTLWEISRSYGVSVSAIQQANDMGRSTLLRTGRALNIPTGAAPAYADLATTVERQHAATYTVRRGDTLSSIARHHGTTARRIAGANGLSMNATLYPGDRLAIPGGPAARNGSASAAGAGTVVHTVRRGDTLWRIASSYRTSVEELCSLNRIRPDTVLYPGTRLTVPID